MFSEHSIQDAIRNHIFNRLNESKCKWDWYGLGGNPMITWDIVRDNPDKPWNWRSLSKNPNITWDIVRDSPDKPWNWRALSKNPNITWSMVVHKPTNMCSFEAEKSICIY